MLIPLPLSEGDLDPTRIDNQIFRFAKLGDLFEKVSCKTCYEFPKLVMESHIEKTLTNMLNKKNKYQQKQGDLEILMISGTRMLQDTKHTQAMFKTKIKEAVHSQHLCPPQF